MPAAKLPVVYDYLDYRAFLRAYYDAKKVWPAESLARRKALFG